MDRALVSGTKGPGFDPRVALHSEIEGLGDIIWPLFPSDGRNSPHYSPLIQTKTGQTSRTIDDRVFDEIYTDTPVMRRLKRPLRSSRSSQLPCPPARTHTITPAPEFSISLQTQHAACEPVSESARLIADQILEISPVHEGQAMLFGRKLYLVRD